MPSLAGQTGSTSWTGPGPSSHGRGDWYPGHGGGGGGGGEGGVVVNVEEYTHCNREERAIEKLTMKSCMNIQKIIHVHVHCMYNNEHCYKHFEQRHAYMYNTRSII